MSTSPQPQAEQPQASQQNQEQPSPIDQLNSTFTTLATVVQDLGDARAQAGTRRADVERIQQQLSEAETRQSSADSAVSSARQAAVNACNELSAAVDAFRTALQTA